MPSAGTRRDVESRPDQVTPRSGDRGAVQLPTDRVLIVDDHEVLAASLVRIVQGRGFVAHAVSGPSRDDIVMAARRLAPVVVLLDVDLGPVGSGADLVEPLCRAGAFVGVVTGGVDRLQLALCVERGARAVIPKTSDLEDLLFAVERLGAGDNLISDQQRGAWLAELFAERRRLAPFGMLTRNERNVLLSLMAGRTAEEVAAETFVSVATVRSHIKSLFRKLGVHSQIAAVALASQVGWKGRT